MKLINSRFGESVEVLHSLDEPFSSPQSGARLVQHLKFDQLKTGIVTVLVEITSHCYVVNIYTILTSASISYFSNYQQLSQLTLWLQRFFNTLEGARYKNFF